MIPIHPTNDVWYQTFTHWGGYDGSALLIWPVVQEAGQVLVGQATEQEVANAITPVINRAVLVGTAVEVEVANLIQPFIDRRVDVGQARERELANGITPAIGRVVLVGQASESELGQGITILRRVHVGQASETELGNTITPVKPIFVQVGQAIEVELGQTITPVITSPGMIGDLVCAVLSIGLVCAASPAASLDASILSLTVDCEIE